MVVNVLDKESVINVLLTVINVSLAAIKLPACHHYDSPNDHKRMDFRLTYDCGAGCLKHNRSLQIHYVGIIF